MTPVINIKNETASTAVFVDYWAVVKICFFIFAANILVKVLFLMFLGTLSQSFGPRTQKKIRGHGQGQPFREQTLSRPRTGMLEAKAKDRGHRSKRSPKKKGLQKFFSGKLQFIGVPKIFD